MQQLLIKRTKGDRMIWLMVALMALISMLVVYSSTGSLAYKYQGGNTLHYVTKHFGTLLFGFALIYGCHLLNYKYYSRIAQILLYITIPLLALTLVIGTEINDAKRWLTVPFIGLSFQTSDLAKLSLIMYISRDLAKRQEKIKSFKQGFLAVMAAPIIVCGLIAPSNLSTASILFVTCLILMFIGRVSMRYIFGLAGAGLVTLALIIVIALNTSFHARVLTWQSRIEDYAHNPKGSYQVQQSKIAIAEGGIMGRGPGNSLQKNYLPSPYSDFIFAIIIEEYGVLGAIIVVTLYLYFLLRSIKIFIRSPNAFGAFLAVGLSFSLVFQAMINMGVVVHLFPVTGVTLPYISMGGTSIWFTSVAIGIILSVSKNVYQENGDYDKTNSKTNNINPTPVGA